MKSFTGFSRFGALYFSRLGSRAHHCLQLQCIFFPLFHYQASTKYLVLEETGNTPATPEKFFHHPYLRCKLPSPCIIHLSLDFTFFPFNPTVYFTQLANHKQQRVPLQVHYLPAIIPYQTEQDRHNHFKLTIPNPKDEPWWPSLCKPTQHSTNMLGCIEQVCAPVPHDSFHFSSAQINWHLTTESLLGHYAMDKTLGKTIFLHWSGGATPMDLESRRWSHSNQSPSAASSHNTHNYHGAKTSLE